MNKCNKVKVKAIQYIVDTLGEKDIDWNIYSGFSLSTSRYSV